MGTSRLSPCCPHPLDWWVTGDCQEEDVLTLISVGLTGTGADTWPGADTNWSHWSLSQVSGITTWNCVGTTLHDRTFPTVRDMSDKTFWNMDFYELLQILYAKKIYHDFVQSFITALMFCWEGINRNRNSGVFSIIWQSHCLTDWGESHQNQNQGCHFRNIFQSNSTVMLAPWLSQLNWVPCDTWHSPLSRRPAPALLTESSDIDWQIIILSCRHPHQTKPSALVIWNLEQLEKSNSRP